MSDPPPTETTTTTGYVLHKALDGFPNYGTGDGTADILYFGGVGAWTFTLPDDAGSIVSATVVVSVVADDSGSGLAMGYGFDLWSGSCMYTDEGNIPHGAPFDTLFTDWLQLSYPAEPNPGASYVVTMANTTPTNPDWLGIEWIELRVTTQ